MELIRYFANGKTKVEAYRIGQKIKWYGDEVEIRIVKK